MKNSKILLFAISIFLFQFNSLGQEFNFESNEINIYEKGNLIIAENGVKILTEDNLEIEGDKSEYNKNKNTLTVSGNVKIIDKENEVTVNSEKIYYLKNEELIISEGSSILKVEDKYIIKSNNLNFNRKNMNVYSEDKTSLNDNKGYFFTLEKFSFDIRKSYLEGENIFLKDLKENKYFLKKINLDLKNYDFTGTELYIDFDNSLYGNSENEPRLSGKKIKDNVNESIIYDGTFTTCKKNKKDCPPWLMSAKEIKHNKKDKIIEYKEAWLEIYKKPVLYFPYFYHPDPTVKRQSGFLAPSIANSNIVGTTFKVPYYKVISGNKDLTFSPQFSIDQNFILQNEYRQAFENSDGIIDLSLAKDGSATKSHFFSNLKGNNDSLNFEINLEKVSNDRYLEQNKIKSPLINNYSLLNSYLNLYKSTDNSYLSTSFEVFEDLNKKKSDRYEYVYPNVSYVKNLEKFQNVGQLDFSLDAFQKNFNTNQYESSLINDLLFKSNKNISSNGFVNGYTLLFRNINTDLKNSTEYENTSNSKMLSTFIYETKYPLKKSKKNKSSFLTPLLSARYSPNKTKNSKNDDRKISYNEIYSLDRIGDKNIVEEGISLTIGSEYTFNNEQNQEVFTLSIANVLRNSKNHDIPIKTTLGNKRSDLIGYLKYKPNKTFNLEYDFSLDKNIKHSNFDLVRANYTVNNFLTSFEYLEEDNIIGEKSYVKNTSKLDINNNSSMSIELSKNLDKNITDYYNLIYEYKNDCMIAAVQYNKTFYEAEDLDADQNIFFTIKIIPFGEISSPKLY